MFFYHRYCPDNNYIYNMAVDSDASADSTTTNINKEHYASYKVLRTYGVSISQYIADNILVNATFARIYGKHALYDFKNNIIGYNFCFSAKYNF